MKKKEKNKKTFTSGFTLVEIMVVLGIVLLLSGMAVGYDRSSEKQLAFIKERAEVIELLNRVKSFALSGREAEGSSSKGCAFGLDFTSVAGEIKMFQEVPSDPTKSCNEASNFDQQEIETFSIDDRVEIVNSPAEVIFEGPYLEARGFSGNFAEIEIGLVNGGDASCIKVNDRGRISSSSGGC